MRVCEVCGTAQEMEENEIEMKQSHLLLHVCESCQGDRKFSSFDLED